MSRIGNKPITIPKGVSVEFAPEAVLSVKGPKGAAALNYRNHVTITQADGGLHVARHSDERQDRAYHGLYQRLVANMIKGVSEGFTRDLELIGVGYRAAMDGKTLVINIGYSHEVRMVPPEGIAFATPKPTSIIVSGHDKQAVGQVAAKVRAVRPPEPYKGKGIRYVGEIVKKKVGKTGA